MLGAGTDRNRERERERHEDWWKTKVVTVPICYQRTRIKERYSPGLFAFILCIITCPITNDHRDGVTKTQP